MNEKLSMSGISPLKARFFDYKHFTYPWHFHPEYEIIYISEGSGTRFIGNSIERYKAGDVFIVGSNLPHYLKSDEIYHAENCNLRTKGTIIQFEKDFMQHSVNFYPQFIRIRNLLENSRLGIFFPSGSSQQLIDLLNLIPIENGIDQITSLLQLLKYMSEMDVSKIISTRDFEYNIHQGTTRIDKIITFINKNYIRKIDLIEIASFSAMNPTAFCRYFKKETGKSFKNFVLDMRIGYACKLLLMNEMNISQISSECGFETISHFNKSFRKVKGYSPTNYRKNML